MNKKRWVCLFGLCVGMVALCAHLVLSQSTTKTLEVEVTAPLPPSNMSFSCSPSNLRSSGGITSMSWCAENATYGMITSNSGRPAPGPVEPCGSTSFASGLNWGGEDVTYTFEACGDGGCATRSCSIGMHCFVRGTKVLMEDGSYKNIEDVRVGEVVMSYDSEKGRYVGAAVVKTTKNDAGKYYYVNDAMKITPGHILNVNGAWKLSDDMKVNDFLVNANGERVAITSLREIVEDVDVFNLITEEPNNFFAEDFLVHNEDALPAHKDRGLAAGMKVSLADGRQVSVEKVKAGDRILAYDAKQKRYTFSTVKATAKQTLSKTFMINEKLRIGTKHQLYRVPPGGKPVKKSK